MEKSEVIQKKLYVGPTLRWSENIKFYIFTSENIKYTLFCVNIFLYFMTLYKINEHSGHLGLVTSIIFINVPAYVSKNLQNLVKMAKQFLRKASFYFPM